MPITRRYLCDDCSYEFTRLHWDRDEPVPACPNCEAASTKNIPGMFAIKTNASRAGDTAYKMAEETYGVTDMNDNLREGDTAFKAPAPVQTAEAEALTREMMSAIPELAGAQAEQVNNFWMKGKMTPDGAPPEQAAQQVIGNAAQGSALARADGADPMALLHKGEKEAGGRMNLEVVGKAKMNETS